MMVQYNPPPDPQSLLPPLLACIPTAFASPRPPPALLPLLSPILRQRVQLLATSTSSSTDSWLPLLCWESEPAQRLVDVITESDAFELHPVSGQIEVGSIEPLKYRRLDVETLQARIAAAEIGITVIVLWCEGDSDGGGSGWRIAEVRPHDGEDGVKSGQWYASMTEADEQAYQQAFEEAIRDEPAPATAGEGSSSTKDEDDDYWAQYDNIPSRSPEPGRLPETHMAVERQNSLPTTSEADYFDRYAQVQPEMDNDDPSEARTGSGGETTVGYGESATLTSSTLVPHELGNPLSTDTNPERARTTTTIDADIKHPTVTPRGSGAATISRLEAVAGSESPSFPSEPAVRQHISTSIKSLFRLCKGTGIERSTFEEIVRRELETLSMIEEDS
ncbi:MAG: hypothetical protein Q9163_003564 [Psora crenata]